MFGWNTAKQKKVHGLRHCRNYRNINRAWKNPHSPWKYVCDTTENRLWFVYNTIIGIQHKTGNFMNLWNMAEFLQSSFWWLLCVARAMPRVLVLAFLLLGYFFEFWCPYLWYEDRIICFFVYCVGQNRLTQQIQRTETATEREGISPQLGCQPHLCKPHDKGKVLNSLSFSFYFCKMKIISARQFILKIDYTICKVLSTVPGTYKGKLLLAPIMQMQALL